VSAIERVCAFLVGWSGTGLGLGVDFGSRVGNRSPALPPGLRVGFTAGMLGRLPTGSGVVIVAGTGGAVAWVWGPVVEIGGALIETAADAVGFFAR
jgi:hypothetical protein